MNGRTASGSIESDAERAELVSLLADGTRAPRWAPAFADVVERDGDLWRAASG